MSAPPPLSAVGLGGRGLRFLTVDEEPLYPSGRLGPSMMLGCLLLLGALLATIKNTRMGPNSRFLQKRCFAEFFPVPRSHACLYLSLGHLRKLSHLRGRFGPTFDRETLEALIVIRKCHETGIFCRNRFFETTKLYCRDVYHSSKLWGTFENSVT